MPTWRCSLYVPPTSAGGSGVRSYAGWKHRPGRLAPSESASRPDGTMPPPGPSTTSWATTKSPSGKTATATVWTDWCWKSGCGRAPGRGRTVVAPDVRRCRNSMPASEACSNIDRQPENGQVEEKAQHRLHQHGGPHGPGSHRDVGGLNGDGDGECEVHEVH